VGHARYHAADERLLLLPVRSSIHSFVLGTPRHSAGSFVSDDPLDRPQPLKQSRVDVEPAIGSPIICLSSSQRSQGTNQGCPALRSLLASPQCYPDGSTIGPVNVH